MTCITMYYKAKLETATLSGVIVADALKAHFKSKAKYVRITGITLPGKSVLQMCNNQGPLSVDDITS